MDCCGAMSGCVDDAPPLPGSDSDLGKGLVTVGLEPKTAT